MSKKRRPQPGEDPNLIRKVGVIVLREGRVLLCRSRKRNAIWILPGGKREPGETSLETLARELHEELGAVELRQPELLGMYYAPAAEGKGKPPRTVEIELYLAELEGNPVASSEIAELHWFGPEEDWKRLAPSLSGVIFPDLILRRILPWTLPAGA